MRPFRGGLVLLALVAIAHAACPAGTSAADLASAVTAAETAYVAMDLDAFRAAREQADAVIPCLQELLTPPDAAAWHRLAGLDAFVQQDVHRAHSAFRAAAAIQPGFNLPTTMAPVGNPLANAYAMARKEPVGAIAALAAPAGTLAYVDGVRATARPTERQALVQLSAASGQVLWSGAVLAGVPAPDWSAFQPVAEAKSSLDAPAPATPKKKGGATRPLAIAAGGAAVASGVLYGMAASNRGEFDDPGTSLDDVEGLAQTTNTLGYSALGVGALALGLGAFAIVTVVW